MKISMFLIFLFYSINAIAFSGKEIDSIYYLLDTAKTPQ